MEISWLALYKSWEVVFLSSRDLLLAAALNGTPKNKNKKEGILWENCRVLVIFVVERFH